MQSFATTLPAPLSHRHNYNFILCCFAARAREGKILKLFVLVAASFMMWKEAGVGSSG
jgi:hypothetical protein